jgi:hypothetical protein
MPAGQRSGSGSQSELNDEQVRKEDILSNRDKAQRRPGQSLDGIGVQVDEYKDVPTNQRGDAPIEDVQHKDGGPSVDTASSRDTDAPEAQSPASDAKDKKSDSSYPRRAD